MYLIGGQKYFDTWQKYGHFSYLAANIFDEETGRNPSWATPYKMIKIGGIKIAFIGLSTLVTDVKTNPKNVKGLKFSKPWVPAQYWIDYLKAGKDEEGIPDLIVA
jgi:2',3'-cyclic-nucleotide 2'-phosphodiesterase (5'-nucleotidase family)